MEIFEKQYRSLSGPNPDRRQEAKKRIGLLKHFFAIEALVKVQEAKDLEINNGSSFKEGQTMYFSQQMK